MQELDFTIIVAQKKENFTDYRRLSSYAINPVWYSVSRGLFCTLVVYTVGLYYARTKNKIRDLWFLPRDAMHPRY